MKKLFSIFSVLLALFLLISSLPMAMALSVPPYNYDNSVWVTFKAERSLSVEELGTLLQVDGCFIMDKQTKEGTVTYQLVVGNEGESVEATIERLNGVEGVTNAARNVYAPDYAKKESYLTLNQTAVEIPVGGIATLKLTDAHLVFDEKQETGIMVAVDHQALPFEQFRDMVTAMGSSDADWDDAYFYALYEDDYNWEKQADYLFLGMWGNNEYAPRYNAKSPIGKYLIPLDCFYKLTTEQVFNKLSEVPQITDVRFAYDVAPGGIPPFEKWIVGNYDIAAVALEGGDEWNQFYTVTVVGKRVGETVVTVQHGEGSRVCYATCTVTVVEKGVTSTDITPTNIVFGDVNGDTNVDAKDALNVLKYSVNKMGFTAKQILAADVTGNQKIDARDALEMLKYSVKKTRQFPFELYEILPRILYQFEYSADNAPAQEDTTLVLRSVNEVDEFLETLAKAGLSNEEVTRHLNARANEEYFKTHTLLVEYNHGVNGGDSGNQKIASIQKEENQVIIDTVSNYVDDGAPSARYSAWVKIADLPNHLIEDCDTFMIY